MKKFLVALLATLSIGCMALGASACSFDKTKLAFNEEYLQEIVLGDPITLDEYIDPMLTNDYTAILTCDETGQERDLKELVQWTTDKPGTYTLTYTVNSGAYKGTISTKLYVVIAEAEWAYSNPTLAYRAGDTISFNYLKRELNIFVESYYGYESYIKEVTHDGVVEDVSEQTSYTFSEYGDYAFLFGVKTKDGQVLEATHTISVRKQQVLATGAEDWLQDNNITAHDYTYIEPNGKVELDKGYCNGSYAKDNVPYLAFNGENGGYGANTYVMADFTGKNMPQVAFFCDEVTSSFTDKKNGILFYNAFMTAGGTLMKAPHPTSFVVFGPNKVGYNLDGQVNFDTYYRLSGRIGDCPAGWNNLDDDCQYRYIVGIEKASATSMTACMLLINLTTNERVWDREVPMSDYQTPNGQNTLNLDADFYKGSIVLYGNYGSDLYLDKVYMPVTGIGSIYELDEAAEFKEGFKTHYALGETVNKSDYIQSDPSVFEEFIVTDPDGLEVELAQDGSFTYTKSGTYRLTYQVFDGTRPSSVTVKVMYDLDKEFAPDYFESEGVIQSFQSNVLGIPETKTDYVKEGSTSIRYYTINAISADKTLDVSIAKSFTDFVFLSKRVAGISFEIYSEKALTYALTPTTTDPTNAAYIREDYTGTIPEKTWTTITLSRDLINKNYNTYKSKNFSISLSLTSATGFPETDQVYIDNVQLLTDPKATIATEAQTFMTTNNITAYDYKAFNADMSVTLHQGLYQGNLTHGTGGMTYNDVSYIGYNGNYGAGDYVVVDFTGKNVPQFCFFAKEITNSLIDGKAGLLVHTGAALPNGDAATVHDGGRVTFFGPNKMEYAHVDDQGRIGPQYGYGAGGSTVNSPLSINGLVDGVHYRYVIGIKEAVAGSKIVLQQLLINLDTKEEAARYETTFTGDWITADYISGNIVMYGRYNVAITLDKIYAVYENVSDIYAIDKVSEVLDE